MIAAVVSICSMAFFAEAAPPHALLDHYRETTSCPASAKSVSKQELEHISSIAPLAHLNRYYPAAPQPIRLIKALDGEITDKAMSALDLGERPVIVLPDPTISLNAVRDRLGELQVLQRRGAHFAITISRGKVRATNVARVATTYTALSLAPSAAFLEDGYRNSMAKLPPGTYFVDGVWHHGHNSFPLLARQVKTEKHTFVPAFATAPDGGGLYASWQPGAGGHRVDMPFRLHWSTLGAKYSMTSADGLSANFLGHIISSILNPVLIIGAAMTAQAKSGFSAGAIYVAWGGVIFAALVVFALFGATIVRVTRVRGN